MALQIQTAPTGVVRDAHYVIPTGASEPVRTLLLEPQRTNLCIRSVEVGGTDWTLNATPSVTVNALAAPDGTIRGSLIGATGTTSWVRQTCTFTGNGTKCISGFIREGTAPAGTALWLFDSTDSTVRARIQVTGWVAGKPTLVLQSGSGTPYPVEGPFANGWWRIACSVDGVIAANENRLQFSPDRVGGVGNVGVFGTQAENAVVPSSYTPTEAAAVVRNADSLYWELASLVPQELTVYARHVQAGGFDANGPRVWQIGENAAAGARLSLESRTVPAYRLNHNNGTTDVLSQVTTVPALSDIVEHRSVLSAGGEVTLAQSINADTEVVGVTSAGNALAGAWAAARFWLGRAANGSSYQVQVTHLGIFRGIRDRAYCRANTGVV